MKRAVRSAEMGQWLGTGGLNTDGMGPQVAELVLRHPDMLPELLHELRHGDERTRGHAADAVERVSRDRPDLLDSHVPGFLAQIGRDPVPMVRWHLAMILGAIGLQEDWVRRVTPSLMDRLSDPSPFVRAWAISGLCQIGRKHPRRQSTILQRLAPLARDPSKAVRGRARKAIQILVDPRLPVPASWTKLAGGSRSAQSPRQRQARRPEA